MQKIKFTAGRSGQLTGHIAGIPCVLEPGPANPAAGETWLIEITKVNVAKTFAHVRAIRRWKGTPEDRRAIAHAHVDFREGTLKLSSRFTFPMQQTFYAQTWNDYRTLADNMNAVIIRGDKAIRWSRKGRPPQVMPLRRFATKYKNQPLIGEPADIDSFLTNLDTLRIKTVEDARMRKSLLSLEVNGV